MSKLYGVGVGPGDKELLTLKAVRIIRQCDVIVMPKAMEGGKSIAYEITKDFINDDKEVLIMHFPMGKEDKNLKVLEAFQVIENRLKNNKDVAFLTIGDPYIYSTYIYLLKHIKEKGYGIETVSGIPSFCACASIAKEHLVIGDERLLIIPSNQIHKLKDEENVVIMKVYKNKSSVIKQLEEKGYDYTFISRAGREGQQVLKDKNAILQSNEYMSLIIAHKKG